MNPRAPAAIASALDVERIREEFPVLHQEVHGRPLVYLDNAATTHKPRAVVEAISRFYTEDNANIHRGLHELSRRATAQYEAARATVAGLLNARDEKEVVFVRGATEAINLVARSFAGPRLSPGDEILISHLEHHANIVPWQMACEETGARLRVAPIDDAGQIDLDTLIGLIGPRTRLVAVGHVSNALGTINPVRRIVRAAHDRGVPVLLDGAQAVSRMPVDVQEIGCDFYALSGHKLYGPTGIGALWGRKKLLDEMPPYQGGGDMILTVSFEGTVYAAVPEKFEAGTPNIAGAIGLAAAIEWMTGIGLDRIDAHEAILLEEATRRLAAIPEVRLIGTAERKAGVISFVLDGVHPHDIGTILDREGVAVRAGHHCAQPVMDRFGVPATVRASFAAYNTLEEIDALIRGVETTLELFAR